MGKGVEGVEGVSNGVGGEVACVRGLQTESDHFGVREAKGSTDSGMGLGRRGAMLLGAVQKGTYLGQS